MYFFSTRHSAFDIWFGNITETLVFDKVMGNSTITRFLIYGMFLQATFVHFSQNPNQLVNKVYLNRQGHLFVTDSRRLVYLQVEIESGVSSYDNTSNNEICGVIESFKMLNSNTMSKMVSFQKIVVIRDHHILVKAIRCKENSYPTKFVSESVDDHETYLYSEKFNRLDNKFVKLKMPAKQVTEYIVNFANKFPIPLNSSILRSSMAYSKSFLQFIGQYNKDKFPICVALTKGMLSRKWLESAEITVNNNKTTTKLLPFSNIYDEMAQFVVVQKSLPGDVLEKHDLYKIAKIAFPNNTKTQKIHFLFYTLLNEYGMWEVEQEISHINQGIVKLLWTVALSDNFDPETRTLVENDIGLYLSKFITNFYVLILQILAQFSAPAHENGKIIEKTLSYKVTNNTMNSFLFIATSLESDTTLLVYIEPVKNLKTSSFTLTSLHLNKGLYLHVYILEDTSTQFNVYSEINQLVKSSTIQTFFDLDIFGSTEAFFDIVKIKTSIHACLFDYEYFPPITTGSLKAALKSLLETHYINIEHHASASIDDKALIFTNENMNLIITFDFVGEIDQTDEQDLKLVLKIMHTFRMKQEYTKYLDSARRIHWIIFQTKHKTLLIFKKVDKPNRKQISSPEEYSDFEQHFTFFTYKNCSKVTNSTVNGYIYQTYSILQSFLVDMSPDVISLVLRRKMKIHAPTLSSFPEELFISHKTTFPTSHLLQLIFYSTRSFYKPLNSKVTSAQYVDRIIKSQKETFCIENTRHSMCHTCSYKIIPFHIKSYTKFLFKFNNTNIELFDDLINVIHKNNHYVNILEKMLNFEWSDVVVLSDISEDNSFTRLSNQDKDPGGVVDVKNFQIKMTTGLRCSSEGSWNLLAANYMDGKKGSKDQCVTGQTFSKISPFGGKKLQLFIINTTYSFIHQPSEAESVYLIGDGYVVSLAGMGRTRYSLQGQDTQGTLTCATGHDDCTLDLRFYARKIKQSMLINSTNELTIVTFGESLTKISNNQLKARHFTQIFDRQNQSDIIHIGGGNSKVKIVHLNSRNQHQDRVSISQDFRGELTLVLTGSKSILNRAEQSQFFYVIKRRRAEINLFLPKRSSRHVVIFDKSYQSVKSVQQITGKQGNLRNKFNSHLVISVTSTKFDDEIQIRIHKSIDTYIEFVFESYSMEIFGYFVLQRQIHEINKHKINWVIPNYTRIVSFLDHKSVVQMDTVQNGLYADSSVLLINLPDYDLDFYLPNCETHFVFDPEEYNLSNIDSPTFPTNINMIKDRKCGNVTTVIHLQEMNAYAHSNNCSIELTVSSIDSKLNNLFSYMVHVAYVTENKTHLVSDLIIQLSSETQLESFVFFLSSYPTVMTQSNDKTVAMLPKPIYFGKEAEFIVLIDSFLEPFTEILIGKSVSDANLKFVLVDIHLLILNLDQTDSVSIIMVDFQNSREPIWGTICLKFKNFTISLSEIDT